jgi:hypothetical protein
MCARMRESVAYACVCVCVRGRTGKGPGEGVEGGKGERRIYNKRIYIKIYKHLGSLW